MRNYAVPQKKDPSSEAAYLRTVGMKELINYVNSATDLFVISGNFGQASESPVTRVIVTDTSTFSLVQSFFIEKIFFGKHRNKFKNSSFIIQSLMSW